MKESAKDIWAHVRAGQSPDTATGKELDGLVEPWDMVRYVTYRNNRKRDPRSEPALPYGFTVQYEQRATRTHLYDGLSAAECLEIFSNNQREVTPTKLTNSQLTVARSEWAMMLKSQVAAQKVKDTTASVSVVMEHDED